MAQTWPGVVGGWRGVGASGLGLVLGVGAWLAGTDPGHSAALGLSTAAAGVCVWSVAWSPDPQWPDDPPTDAGGGWHGAALQSRLLERLDDEPERVPHLLLPRLRALLAAELARHGVHDPRSAAARELVGAPLYDLLSRSEWTATAGHAATDLTAAVLARLDEMQLGARRPGPAGVP